MIREYVFVHLVPRTATGPNMGTIASALPVMRQQTAILDSAVKATGFVAGPELTYADLGLVRILAAVGRRPEGKAALEETPALSAYHDAYAGRPSFKATAAAS